MASTGVVVFTRDLRVQDHPALARAVREHDLVVPLFVFDEVIFGGHAARPNRTGFLLESLADLDRSLRSIGGRLVMRRGKWVESVLGVAAEVGAADVYVSQDVGPYAQSRGAALERAASGAAVRVHRSPGITLVEPGAITPGSNGEYYQVFTPYYRRWSEVRRRAVVAAPGRIAVPAALDVGSWPELTDLARGDRSPDVPIGGARAAHDRLDVWVDSQLRGYDDHHDDLARDATSRLSPYLHFGCVSPLEVAHAAGRRRGSEAFLRQLCWRDFYSQILAVRPDAAWSDLHPRGDEWRNDPDGLEAWQEGRTGFPVVDAAMRQLRREGWMHNRARLVVASFLTKDLYIDWRAGARHFLDMLLDGDIANNNLNWQWVAGTGSDTNPHRVFNPTVQGARFDPDGDYVRRYVPELRAVKGGAVHEPDAAVRRAFGYPDPIVDHHEAIAEYRWQTGARR